MLDNSSSDSPAAAASIATVKRYAPPNQRNRSLGRRKSGGDRLERANSCGTDGDRNPGSTKSGPTADHGDAGYNIRANESLRGKLIPLQGCCNSEASQFLNNRWAAAMSAYKSLPDDSVERPLLYTTKNASAWSQAILPHLRDFLSELRRAMHNAKSSPNA